MNKNGKTAAKGRRQVGALPYKVVDEQRRGGDARHLARD